MTKSNHICFVFLSLLVLLVPARNAYAQDANMLLFDGETGFQCAYGSPTSTQAFRGRYCFEGAPDSSHQPVIRLTGLPSYRANISDFDEIWFYIKCDQLGKTFSFQIGAYTGASNTVSGTAYIDGGVLDTTYRLVRIPLSALKTATYTLDKIEGIYFGVASPTVGHKLYVDEMWAVRLGTIDPKSMPMLQVLALDFGDVRVKSVLDKILRIGNSGTAALQVTGIAIDGAGAAEFSAASSAFTLNPGQSRDVTVRFSPVVHGDKSASVTISHNASFVGTVTQAPLIGRGVSPSIQVSQMALQFGDVPVGSSASWKLAVQNSGNQDLHVSSLQASPQGFSVTPGTLVVPVGGTAPVSASFAPATATNGVITGNLKLLTDDPNAGVLDVALTGIGTAQKGVASQLLVLAEQMTSSTVSLAWPGFSGVDQVRVYVGAEPSSTPDGSLPGQLLSATLPGNAQEYRVEKLAAAADMFFHVEARGGGNLVAAGNVHARTTGGPRAQLDTPVREVHAVAPNILMVVLENKDVQSYAKATGSLVGSTGVEWQAGPWTVTRGSGSPIPVTQVNRHSIPVALPHYEVGVIVPSRDDLLDVDHEIYLVLGANIGNREMLRVQGPFSTDFLLPFSDYYLETPVIQLNQVGYSPRATQRWAYVSGWLGDGGPLSLANFPATAEVVLDPDDPESMRTPVVSGLAVSLRATMDLDSGTDVKEINLASVPQGEGVVYRVRIPGVGVSWPTQVSETAVFKAFFTAIRGLYFNRWGGDLRPECTEWSRPPDHPTVYTAEKAADGFFPETQPKVGERPLKGGHHDAGDFDIRVFHSEWDMQLLHAYEANPEAFTDGQLIIPESGNGIPDLLDEGLWAIAAWEQLQEDDGGVRFGVESYRHPSPFAHANDDPLPYWTYSRDPVHTMRAGAMFAQAARLVAPFDAAKANTLKQAAIKAYQYAVNNGVTAQTGGCTAYASGELFRLTGEQEPYGRMFETTWATFDNPPGRGLFNYYRRSLYYYDAFFNPTQPILSYHMLGYLCGPNAKSAYLPVADTVFAEDAAKAINEVNTFHAHRNARPVGSDPAWGAGTSVGDYVIRLYAAIRFKKQAPGALQDYFDALSLSADYVLGANQLGLVWMTGLGSRCPEEVLHADFLAFLKEGKGAMPGICAFGPSHGIPNLTYCLYGVNTFYPPLTDHPLMRRFGSIRTLVRQTETASKLMARDAELFGMLVLPGMMPPDSWRPGGREHRNRLAPREVISGGPDTTPPVVTWPTAPRWSNSSPITVSYSGVQDASGLKEVRLWVKKGATGTWQDAGLPPATTASGSFSYPVAGAEDTYYFALRAEDNASNLSPVPSGSSAAATTYDTTAPNPGTASTTTPSTRTSPLTITYTGVTDSLSGLKEVRLWVKKDTGPWQDTGVRSNQASGALQYTPPAEGRYVLFVQAVDNAGNTSPAPSDATVFTP
jgi:endoglucanase